MDLATEKWIKEGQYIVEIKGSLPPEECDLIEKYGDMRIDLSDCKSRKSYSKLIDFSASGSFTNEEEANAFVQYISKKLKTVLEDYRNFSGEFEDKEVYNIEGLELIVIRKLKHHNYHLHISTKLNPKSRELIEKFSDQDIDVSTEKFTSHVQSLSPQSPKILSLRIDKNFENAVDACEYRDKIMTQLQQIMKEYANKKDGFTGREEIKI